jgi:probable phosphoglycerate mutase
VTAARIVCWRHGRTGHNHGGIWQGQLDIPLDEVGQDQVADAAAVLAASMGSGAPRGSGAPLGWGAPLGSGAPLAIASSDLIRASATADALAALTGCPVTLDKRLREIDAGRWQGLTRAQIIEAGMGDDLAAWQHGEDVRIGGGERRGEVALRGATAIREHVETLDGGTLVVVAHGGLLRGSILELLGLAGERWDLLGSLGNAHWVELVREWPIWRLAAYNVRATPIANRFGGPPPGGDRLAQPRR